MLPTARPPPPSVEPSPDGSEISYCPECTKTYSSGRDSPLDQAEKDTAAKASLFATWLSSSANLQPRPSTCGRTSGYTPVEDAPEARWGIHWVTPVSIVALLIISIQTACAHHLYYASLHGTQAGTPAEQQWVSRIGTAFAFLFKTTLVAAVGTARKQWMWDTLRKQFITMEGINALFGVTSDPLQFFNIDMLRSAILSTIMALVMWTIPLTSILTPGTISVTPGTLEYYANCTEATTKYTFDNVSDSETFKPDRAHSFSQHFRNEYYGPSDYARAGFTAAAYDWGSLNSKPERVGCPVDAKCSYNVTIVLPTMECSKEGYYTSSVSPWVTPEPWASVFDKVPDGYFPVFVARRDRNNRNTLWVGHTQIIFPIDRLTHTIFRCRNSISRYTLHNIRSDGFLEINTATVNNFTLVDDVAGLESPDSNKFDASLALFDTMVELLEGSILGDALADLSNPFNVSFENMIITEGTKVGSTMLSRSLFSTMTYNLINELLDVTFAMAVLPLYIDDTEASAIINTTCAVVAQVNLYEYDQFKLLIAYISATVVGSVFVILGFYALAMNGVASDTNFSTILLTTRNPTLDQLTAGGCLGGNPLPKHLEKLRLRFGEISSIPANENGIRHTALGVEGEMAHIRRRGRYS